MSTLISFILINSFRDYISIRFFSIRGNICKAVRYYIRNNIFCNNRNKSIVIANICLMKDIILTRNHVILFCIQDRIAPPLEDKLS